MNKVVEYIIGAKDATGNAIKSALSRLKSFATSVGSNLQNIRAAFGMMQTAARNAVVFMQKAFAFETMTVQFKTLIGNMDEARAHMRMLQEMGDTPPFSLEEFAAASRSLMVMTDGALGYKRSLELVGDAAAATGQPIQNLAHEVGRAYAIIRDGQPLTRATMGLRNMGAITPEVAAKLDELQKSGASVQQIWETLTTELGKFKGAMAETEKTGDGLVGAIKSQWDNTLRDFGTACMETCKDGLQALLDWMRRLREDGSIAAWAESFGQSLDKTVGKCREAVDAIQAIASGIEWLYERSGISDAVHGVNSVIQGAASALGTAIGGGGWDEVGKAYNEASIEELGKGYYSRKLMESGFIAGDDVDRYLQAMADEEKEAAERVENARSNARRRVAEAQAQKEREAAEKEKEEEERIQKQLAEAQAKIDAKRAEEKARLDAEAAKKAAEEEEKYRLALEREIAKERERLWRADLKAQEAEYRRAQKEEADARARLSDAVANEQRAWGWYRDRDSWKAQLQEERADAEAQKQFDKDFAKLKDRYRDWRTSDRLSDDDELIRRVALAREEKAAAEEYAKQTAEATQACADALEAIQKVMTTEEA